MEGKLKWRFDASTFKLLGRGLITDRITAIYELVKNCYDADATSVDLEFYDIEAKGYKSKIIIKDNGQGMSLNDITNKWLVVGTSSKRNNLYSPKYHRRYIGEKGVGRFATDKLGEHLTIKTKQKNDDKILKVTINWKDYEQFANVQGVLFTDLENEYTYIENDNTFPDENGTELCITQLHEAWDKEMLLRLHNQLTRILSPIQKSQFPFDIRFFAPAFEINDENIKPEPIESLATVSVHIPFDEQNNKQGSLIFNKQTQSFEIEYIEPDSFGLISIQFYYFNAEAQKEFKTRYKNTQHYIEGVKIYRDGVICTPFAEYEKVVDTRRDILGIDKRRHVEAFDKLSSREVIGIVDITKDRNPNIIDATNRQDFVANGAYRKLKEFIIRQLDILVLYKFVKREEKKEVVQNNLKRASSDARNIEKDLQNIIEKQPELKEVLAPALKKATNIKTFVKEGIKDKEEEKKEFLRKENLYLSLMSLQDFANTLAHDIRFELIPVKHAAEFFMLNYPNPQYEYLYQKYSKLIFAQTEKISHLVDFMLSFAKTDIEESTFSVKDLLEGLLRGIYALSFDNEHITTEIDIPIDIELTGNRKFIEDVLTNLISNSLKALKSIKNKKIKCECYVDESNIYLLFSDNGCGVDKNIEKQIFDMFITTTAEQGGAGMGLFIAKTRMEALNGTIELIPSIFSPIGATFKLSLPLKTNFNKFKR